MEWKEHEQKTEAMKSQLRAINRDEQREGERWRRQAEAGVCVCVYSLLDIPDLHAGRAAAAGTHEGLRPQLRDLCTPCLKTQTHTNISDPAGAKQINLCHCSFVGQFYI